MQNSEDSSQEERDNATVRRNEVPAPNTKHIGDIYIYIYMFPNMLKKSRTHLLWQVSL